MARVLIFCEFVCKSLAVLLWCFTSWDALGLVLFFGPDVFVLYHLFVPSSQWLCPVVTEFQPKGKEVWLTIDDGPDADDTPRILDLLDEHGARATFFVVGERVARWPHLIGEIVRRGHEVAHHTHTHPAGTFWCASRARLGRELDDTLAVLRAAGARPRRFRPPVGIKNVFLARALAKRGLECVGWTVRSGDWLARRAEDVVENVMKNVRPGAIVLMHEGSNMPRAVRVRAISGVLQSLTASGFRCVVPAFTQSPAVANDGGLTRLEPNPIPIGNSASVVR